MNSLMATRHSRYTKISEKEEQFFCARRTLNSTDFGKFYAEHRSFIDKIIEIWAFKYQPKYDIEDIRQEVLYNLQRYDVLGKYDPKRSNLGTFLTSRIINYIGYAIRDLPVLFSNSGRCCKYPSSKENSKVDFEEFDEFKHSTYEDETFESICLRDRLVKLKENVSSEVWSFICMLRLGMNASEIARAKKVSRFCITSKYMSALKTKAIQKIFEE